MQIRMQPIHALLISGMAATASAMSAGGGEETAPTRALTDQPAQDGSVDMTLIRTYFKNGLNFETADKSFTYKTGAKIFYDNAFIHNDNDYHNVYDREQDGAKFRLARISGEGAFNEKIEFKWQYDFAPSAGNEVKFKDLFIGLKNVCPFNLRIGQFKEPMGLEELTSISNSTFL